MKVKKAKRINQPLPNRFVTHVAYGYTIQGRAFFESHRVISNEPLTQPRHFEDLEKRFEKTIRSRVKTADANGAPVIGLADKLEVRVAVLNLMPLMAFFKPDAVADPVPADESKPEEKVVEFPPAAAGAES